MKTKEFLGRNIARFKFGKEYVNMLTTMLTAISTTSIFLNLPFSIFFILIIFGSIFVWLLGYIVEKRKILEIERETTNMVNVRFQKKLWTILMNDVIGPIIKEIIIETKKQDEIK